MNEFSGISVTVLQGWLADAQTAMQSLALGKQAVAIGTSDGKSIRFTASELPQLRRYILRIQTAIAIAQGTSSSSVYSVASWTR